MSNKGFGTNFHQVYGSMPAIYHKFSKAEIFSDDLMLNLRRKFRGNILLDIACGTCHKTNIISKYFKKVYALDFSPALLDFAREIYGNNSKINFLLASASKIPLLNSSVDTIFISWGSFPLAKTIREMKRVLAPGGVILRIGIYGDDEFTRLFPSLDKRRLSRIQNQFDRAGFVKQLYNIPIIFCDISAAKKVLSLVLKINPRLIKSKSFNHKIYLHSYVKPYGKLQN